MLLDILEKKAEPPMEVTLPVRLIKGETVRDLNQI
jgi:DNA-binding LacI/PurR family transcriptional regulator